MCRSTSALRRCLSNSGASSPDWRNAINDLKLAPLSNGTHIIQRICTICIQEDGDGGLNSIRCALQLGCMCAERIHP
jgi:hypothetical protein